MSLVVTTLLLVTPASNLAQHATYPLSDAPEHLRPAITKAEAVFNDLQKALLSRLSTELKAGGPGRALSTCHSEAARIADRVVVQSGIRVGRTSQRLRNRANVPPDWARPLVAATTSSRASEAHAMVVDLGDRVGVLRPIGTVAMCTNCHGPNDELPKDVRAQLERLYADDRATGFRVGDLRGWMWAEVPVTR
jgi:hypothetical protein